MNSTFDQNQSVLGVFVLSVLFQMFSDSHGFLDEVIQIFWDLAGQTFRSQNSENLRSRQMFDLQIVNVHMNTASSFFSND